MRLSKTFFNLACAPALITALMTLAVSGAGHAMMGFNGPPPCETHECFAAKVAECSVDARYMSRSGAGASALYMIRGETAGGRCELGMVYISNPNPEWVDKPLTFTVDPGRDLEPQLKEALDDCLAGRSGGYDCAGPLFRQQADQTDG